MKLQDGTLIEITIKPKWGELDFCAAVNVIDPDGKAWGFSFNQELFEEFVGTLTNLKKKFLDNEEQIELN